MARPNYSQQKNQKDQAKKKKREEKLQRKQERSRNPGADASAETPELETPDTPPAE